MLLAQLMLLTLELYQMDVGGLAQLHEYYLHMKRQHLCQTRLRDGKNQQCIQQFLFGSGDLHYSLFLLF